jgi:phosphoribosylamine-glycine ligase
VNDSEPIQIDDDEEEIEEVIVGPKRKLTSGVWNEFKKVKLTTGEEKAQCNYCHKEACWEKYSWNKASS